MKVTGGGGARDHTYVYDASNRLVNIKNTVGGATVVGLGYDPQGNLANWNGPDPFVNPVHFQKLKDINAYFLRIPGGG